MFQPLHSGPRLCGSNTHAFPRLLACRVGALSVLLGAAIPAFGRSPGQSPQSSEAEIVEVTKIWDQAPHNAFTDLIRFRDAWYCVFREAGQHGLDPEGALRIVTSRDGKTWTPTGRFASPKGDVRDAKISITPDGRLMVSGSTALTDKTHGNHQGMAWFSADAKTWDGPHEVADPSVWLWRVTWRKGTAYGVGYGTADKRFIRLYKSTDGKHYETVVADMGAGDYPNETSLVFLEDDTCLCLLRRGAPAMIGRARPPYTDWTWKDLGVSLGGPHMIRLPDGRFVAAGRLYDKRQRTGLCWLDPEAGTLEEFLTLPSGGDTSYPGLVLHEGLLWVSYYSSHEGKTSIYLAKVKLPGK